MKFVIRPILACTAIGLAAIPAAALAGEGKAPVTVTEGTATPAATPHGFVEMIGQALAQVELRADQEAAVEWLSMEIEPLQARVDTAENALLSALADQVEAGRIDRAALEPVIAGYVEARMHVSPDIRRVMEDLHGILDPDQRADFADALECVVHDVHQAMVSGERVDDLTKAIGLRPDQVARIQEGIVSIQPALRAQRALLHQILEAFRGEDFAIERILPSGDVADMARARAERIVDLTASLVDVLDPAQRAPLAARIRDAVKARTATTEEPVEAPSTQSEAGDEGVGVALDPIWVGRGFRRGPFGGVRGGFVVGGRPGFWGPARWAYGGVRAFPYAAAWGYGW